MRGARMRAYGERHGDAWLEGDVVRWARGDRKPFIAMRRMLKRRARRVGVAETVLPPPTGEPENACDGFFPCAFCDGEVACAESDEAMFGGS